MEKKKVNRTKRVINWNYPEPTRGIDQFVGPGATRAELFLQLSIPLLAAALMAATAHFREWGWSIFQIIVAALVAWDMMGGIITNATSSAKRWYHREGQGFRQHFVFILIHFIQPVLIMALFDYGNWTFVIGSYLYLIGASVIILKTAQYLQRPVALTLLAAGICLGLYVIPVPAHFEWFLPLFFIKLLVSHLLVEEPYRPATE